MSEDSIRPSLLEEAEDRALGDPHPARLPGIHYQDATGTHLLGGDLSAVADGKILAKTTVGGHPGISFEDIGEGGGIPTSQKGAVGGVGTLDAEGHQPTSELSPSVVSGSALGAKIRPARPVVMLGVTGQSSPAEADFKTFNGLLTPRSVDALLLFTTLETDPPYYSSWPAWAERLNATLLLTPSPASTTLGSYAGGSKDSTGLHENHGLAGLAAQIRQLERPVLIRLAHEFNGNWNSYGSTHETAAQFVAGWQHIVNVFRANGAVNAQWVWCANVWGDASTIDPTVADGSGVNWYPGDEYVDIISLDGYQKKTSAAVQTPVELFLSDYESICKLTDKPFGITEFGCAADTRLAGMGGKAGWYSDLFQMIRNDMPRCVLLTNWERVSGAEDTTINSSGTDTAAEEAFVQGVAAPPFKSALGVTLSKITAAQLPSPVGFAQPPRPRPIWSGMEPTVTTLQSGHGWTAAGTGGTLTANDTSVFTLGTQSCKLTTNGSGGVCRVEKAGIPTFDLGKQSIAVLVRISDVSKLARAGLKARIGTGAAAGWGTVLWSNAQVTSPLASGEWQWLVFDVANASAIGTPPALNACSYIALELQDASTGAVSLNVNAVKLLPKPSTVFPNGVVSVSFDDGWVEQYTNARPYLDKYGFAATAYLINDLITSAPSSYMSFAQLTEMQNNSGWEMAAHAARLADHNVSGGFTALTTAQLIGEAQDMLSWFLTNGFPAPAHWASPQGKYSAAVLSVMSQYFASHRTIDFWPNGCEVLPVRNAMAIRCQPLDTRTTATFTGLIDQAYANGDWLNLYTHRVLASGATGTQISTANFQTVVDYLNSKGIPVLPVGKVLQMLSAGRL